MKLLVITSSEALQNEDAHIRQMLDMGLPTLHVRKPNLSMDGLKKYLDNFSKEHQKKMVIHTHHGLLWDYDLKGIHLSKSDKKNVVKTWMLDKLVKFRRKNAIKSTSCSSLSSLALSYNTFDYIMLTPIFAGPQEHRPTFSRGTLDTIIKKYPNKIIARGGANIDNMGKAVDIGFSGIAFHNAIWKNPDPAGELSNILKRYKDMGLSVE